MYVRRNCIGSVYIIYLCPINVLIFFLTLICSVFVCRNYVHWTSIGVKLSVFGPSMGAKMGVEISMLKENQIKISFYLSLSHFLSLFPSFSLPLGTTVVSHWSTSLQGAWTSQSQIPIRPPWRQFTAVRARFYQQRVKNPGQQRIETIL